MSSKDKLPCQLYPPHSNPSMRPSLPPNFRVAEEAGVDLDAAQRAVEKFGREEFLISLSRYGMPNLPSHSAQPGELPPWGGIHALISTGQVPLMRFGFLPVVPSTVTDYATVRKALSKFQSARQQLQQDIMPVVSDDGVFHTVVDILLNEPDTFADLFLMLGMFHMAKVLLRCAGRYLSGSGVDDALIECEVFGKKTLAAVLSGSHYT